MKSTESFLRQKLARQLIESALGDGRKNNYYPWTDLVDEPLPEDLQGESVQLVLELLRRENNWPNNIEYCFLRQIGKLSPANQALAMQAVEIIATYQDNIIPSFAVRCIAESFDQLTPENQTHARRIYEALKETPSEYVRLEMLNHPIFFRPLPEIGIVTEGHQL